MNIRTVSFNLRTSTAHDGRHNWKHRAYHVASEIRLLNADVLGLQEVTHDMLVYLKGQLSEYEFYGIGRDDGLEAGEYSSILYRKGRFTWMDGGNFWLSETPDVPGSFGWDAACIRIATWVVLQGEDKKPFFFLNTHTDHEGVEARNESSKLIRKKVTELAKDMPVIITGDFNASPKAESIQHLIDPEQGLIDLVDTRAISERGHLGPDFTFHNFKLLEYLKDPAEMQIDGIIDYIFASSNIRCKLHAASTTILGDFCISDHLPVIADLLL